MGCDSLPFPSGLLAAFRLTVLIHSVLFFFFALWIVDLIVGLASIFMLKVPFFSSMVIKCCPITIVLKVYFFW